MNSGRFRELIDISPRLDADLAPWPGDVPYRLSFSARLERGDSINLGAATMSLHTGAHIDAPLHFSAGGPALDGLPLDIFIGPARVVDARGPDLIPAGLFDLPGGAPPSRVLVRTDFWPDRSRFPERIPTLARDVPARLGTLGVRLLGIDLPSVDAIDSSDLPIHHALHQAGVLIMEGIRLEQVEPGDYWLCALPLALAGADASPVRAVLLRGATPG